MAIFVADFRPAWLMTFYGVRNHDSTPLANMIRPSNIYHTIPHDDKKYKPLFYPRRR
jgi:hypothetical protein